MTRQLTSGDPAPLLSPATLAIGSVARPAALTAISLWQAWLAWRLGFEPAALVALYALVLAVACLFWVPEPRRRPWLTALFVVPFLFALGNSVQRVSEAASALRDAVDEGVDRAAPVRTALGRAVCAHRWPPVDHAALGLPPAGAYAGRFARGARGELLTAGLGRITISYGRIPAPPSMPGLEIASGSTLELEGRCDRNGRVRWTMASGDVREVARRVTPWRVCWLCR